MTQLPHTLSCFVCGEANPHGLKLRFEADGQVIRTRFTPRAEHIGFKGVTHGGLLATVLDEIMVWAVAVTTRRFAYCAEMTVRFHQPAQPDVELLVIAELVENRRNKLFAAKAELCTADGTVVAAATGKYLPIPADDVKTMLSELVGDRTFLNQAASPAP